MNRVSALAALVRMEVSVEEAITQLQAYPWDSHSTLVTLAPEDFARVLQRYREGLLAESEIEAWANALECREDIGFAPESDSLLRALLHELANPVVAEPLSNARAEHWLAELRHAS